MKFLNDRSSRASIDGHDPACSKRNEVWWGGGALVNDWERPSRTVDGISTLKPLSMEVRGHS